MGSHGHAAGVSDHVCPQLTLADAVGEELARLNVLSGPPSPCVRANPTCADFLTMAWSARARVPHVHAACTHLLMIEHRHVGQSSDYVSDSPVSDLEDMVLPQASATMV